MATHPSTASIKALTLGIELPKVVMLLGDGYQVDHMAKNMQDKLTTNPITWGLRIDEESDLPMNLFKASMDFSVALLTRVDMYMPNTLDTKTMYAYCSSRYGYQTGKWVWFEELEEAVLMLKTKHRMGLL